MNKIVVLDGNGEFTKELADRLTKEGFEVSGIADDGEVGLEYIQGHDSTFYTIWMYHQNW